MAWEEYVGEVADDVLSEMEGEIVNEGQQAIFEQISDQWQDKAQAVLEGGFEDIKDWRESWVADLGEDKYNAVSDMLDEGYDNLNGAAGGINFRLGNSDEARAGAKAVSAVMDFVEWASAFA